MSYTMFAKFALQFENEHIVNHGLNERQLHVSENLKYF